MKKENYRNLYQYNNVYSTTPSATFNNWFWNVQQNSVSHIGHWQSNCPMKEISEDEAKSFENKCTFLSLFHFLSDYFDMDSRDFDFDTIRNKAKVKENLHKNLEHWYHIEANLSVVDTIEND